MHAGGSAAPRRLPTECVRPPPDGLPSGLRTTEPADFLHAACVLVCVYRRYDEVRCAVVLADDRMPERLTRPGHAHRERHQRHHHLRKWQRSRAARLGRPGAACHCAVCSARVYASAAIRIANSSEPPPTAPLEYVRAHCDVVPGNATRRKDAMTVRAKGRTLLGSSQ